MGDLTSRGTLLGHFSSHAAASVVVATVLTWTFQASVRAALSSEGGVMTQYGYDRESYSSYDNGYGYGNGYGPGDSYVSDFDEEWAKMSGRVQRPKCVDIPVNLTLCHAIGYDKMMLPNLLQHDSLLEVTQQARSWVPLVGLHCHPDTKVFLCSLFSPVCLDRLIYPCRTLCESVRDSCRDRMIPYGFDWPEMLRCNKFPEDNDMCIKLIHDVKPDNNCSACKQPLTYEAIIDNYCRADFVIRVKIDKSETQGGNKALILKKAKRFYKKDNITKKERDTMAPLLKGGAECSCDAISNTKERFLLMGAKKGEELVVTYVVEFQKKSKDFQRAFKAIKKGDVCEGILKELSVGELDKKAEKEKAQQDDGHCVACVMPVKYATIVENYCLADFVLQLSVKGLESRDGHQALVLKSPKMKSYKKGGLSKKEEKSLVLKLEGKEDCTCALLDNKKARFLLFGSKRDDQHYVNYLIEFDTNNKDFQRAIKDIEKGDACLGILRGTGEEAVDAPKVDTHSTPKDNSTTSGAKSGTKKGNNKKKDGGNKKGKRKDGKKGKKGKGSAGASDHSNTNTNTTSKSASGSGNRKTKTSQ